MESFIAPKYDKSHSFLFREYIPRNLYGPSFSILITGHKLSTFYPLEKYVNNSLAFS